MIYEKNELVCYIMSHSQMFNQLPLFSSVTVVVVCPSLRVHDILETINLLHNMKYTIY